jgi:hypothetical protein
MKSEKLTDAWDKLALSDETENRILRKIEQKLQPQKKRQVFKPAKIVAIVAALVIIVGLINIQTVIAFVRGMFFVPGIGKIDNDISIFMMQEPVEIDSDIGKVTLEFVTKMKGEDDKYEVFMYFTSTDQDFLEEIMMVQPPPEEEPEAKLLKQKELLSPATIIDGVVYPFEYRGGGGGRPSYNVGYSGHFNSSNLDFPDVNEFVLRFGNTETRIVLTELSDEDKTPYVSKEINGISVLAYKFKNNNKIICVDVINNNNLGELYDVRADIMFNSVTGKRGGEIQIMGGHNNIKLLNNESDIELTGIKDLSFVTVEYYATKVPGDGDLTTMTTKPQLTLPIPKDGETLKTDIKIPVGSIFYEITDVKREGDTIYFKDNNISNNPEFMATFDLDAAVKNNEVYIIGMRPLLIGPRTLTILTIDTNNNSITGFNPDDDFITVNLRSIEVVYCGDYSVDLTKK